ncbi:putative papain-like cysteine peptidase superfamily [Helianthus annuus]|nr:putative papain-like cysteine peptidase superfamily [Helianthus annuus]KAJ0467797.1 putative papain-like cysteine peptidase superfamily [Helianthus annuus]
MLKNMSGTTVYRCVLENTHKKYTCVPCVCCDFCERVLHEYTCVVMFMWFGTQVYSYACYLREIRLTEHIVDYILIFCRKLVFETESGVGLYHFQMLDLQPSKWINDGVINGFASMLNYEEKKRISGSNIFGDDDKVKGIKPRLFGQTNCFDEDMLLNRKHEEAGRVEKFKSALFLVVDQKESLMSLSEYCVICFPILEHNHFYLVSFMERNAITVIVNIDASKSPIHLMNNDNFFQKSTPYKVKDIFSKYLKMVNHPKSAEIEIADVVRLEFEWKTVNNTVDCGVFVRRHMETWFGVTADKWDSGFPLTHKEKKACLTNLRKKYAIKLVTSEANKHRSRVLDEAAEHEKTHGIGCF